MNKDNCFDLFQTTKVNDVNMYPEKPVYSLIKYKVNKQQKEVQYMRLKLLRTIGAFKGLTLIEILLNEIRLAKEIFLLDIAQGDEILIPRELG